MHLPVWPVRGELELGNEPAMTKAIEFRLWPRPEALTTRKPFCGTTGSEMDVGFTWIEEHRNLRFSRLSCRLTFELSRLRRLAKPAVADRLKRRVSRRLWGNGLRCCALVPEPQSSCANTGGARWRAAKD